ncbi:MAG TPA: hypothetical protein VN736_01095 [Candidatus Limnocylindrales bacterium]|nr:hypothetical protein [Candidatus Limnocylindrales bacterium]
MLLHQWTPQFIDGALSTLTDKEANALNCSLTLHKNQEVPGETRLTKFGFADVWEYELHLNTAKRKALDYFAGHGVHRLNDLDFERRHIAIDGLISHGAIKVSNAAC